MFLLGVYENIYGVGAEMTIQRALLISVVGFLIVFLMLGILALFVKAQGKVFDSIAAKKAAAKKQALANAIATPTVQTKGTPLPEGMSAGELKLNNVSDEEAAMVMAIVSYQTKIPLNRLQFNSISLKQEEKK